MPTHLLLVEDCPADAALLRGMLDSRYPGQYITTVVETLGEAKRLLAQQQFDAALLDLSLPDSQGLETIGQIASASADLPIVVLTGVAEEKVALEAVRRGAQDYLLKFHADGAAVARAIHYAIDRKMAQRALEREKGILKYSLEASDHERQMIGYEIHDGLAQQLAGALMQFSAAEGFKGRDPQRAAEALAAGLELVRESYDETRRLIGGLRSPALEDDGLVAAVSQLVEVANRRGTPTIEFQTAGLDRLEPLLENAAFRIIQEGVANACRHSGSKRISIQLGRQGSCLHIEVQDWGVGFDVRQPKEGHFGLEGIQRRVRVLGGQATIHSLPGQGTRIVVDLPVTGSAAPSSGPEWG